MTNLGAGRACGLTCQLPLNSSCYWGSMNTDRMPGGFQAVGSGLGLRAPGKRERPSEGCGLGPLCPGPRGVLQGGSEVKENSGGRGDTCRHTVTIQRNEGLLLETLGLRSPRRRTHPEDLGCRQRWGRPAEEGGRFGMNTTGRGGRRPPGEGQEPREGKQDTPRRRVTGNQGQKARNR